MKTLVIDRSRWLRGNPDESCLLDRDGRMCCLGFYLRSCGADESDIFEIGSPAGIAYEAPQEAGWLLTRLSRDDVHEATRADSSRCTALMTVNDDATWTDEQREREIAHLFSRQGIDVVFVDEASPPITNTPNGSNG